MKLFISIDRKNKPESLIEKQIADAKEKAENVTGKKLEVVDSVNDAYCAWFVDEWQDDVECYKEHQYCIENGIIILHDESEFWNRQL